MVEAPRPIEGAGVEVAAFDDPGAHARFGDLTALAANLVAALAAEAVEEGVEVGVALVLPMKLVRMANREAADAEKVGFVFGDVEKVQPGGRLAHGGLAGGVEERFAHGVALAGREQEAAAADGGKRRRAEQLGVVGQPHAAGGIGPGPVEDELAVAVILAVERQGADQLAAAAGQGVAR
ncbi:MAG: hypothetical protein KC620_00635 [Myxococcales bacterium]|nr:hypothetical protein [Myxococcales bacterium]